MRKADAGFASHVLAALGLALLVVLAVLLVAQTIDILLLVFLSLVLALGLRDAARWVGPRLRLSEPAALVAVLAALTVTAWLAVWLAAPGIVEQSQQLAEQLPQAIADAQRSLQQSGPGRWLLEQVPNPGEFLPKARSLLGRAPGVFTATFGALANLLVLVTLTLFLVFQLPLYREGVVRLVPPSRRDRCREVLGELGRTLSMWLIGRSVAMLVIALLTTVGLWLLSVPLAPILALIAGLLNFIPNFGPIVALVPALLLGLTKGFDTALWVIGLYTGIQLVESYVLTPYIQQRAISMPPALLITTQVILGVMLGFLGLLLATPLTAAAMVLVRRLYIEDFLEPSG
jgi:predicted PurR-regulated permease PerM